MSASPRLRVEAECGRRGRREVVADCVSILTGAEPPDFSLLIVLGGPAAPRVLAGDSRADAELWSRVWAARGLLWALDPTTVPLAASAVVGALHDPAWRVREKAAQVVARHLIDVAVPELVVRRDTDPVERVRAAAERALRRLTVTG